MLQDTIWYIDYAKSKHALAAVGNPKHESGARSNDGARIDQRARDIIWPVGSNSNRPSRPSNHPEWSSESLAALLGGRS